ncbi:MAG: hypothetical protein H6713_03810 [Myxococcales bacterium]|nr:hypothetical protein [Myxococcales bacterium]MCB9749115.1 hypothetical protein [Myxococcales bacterium]
MLLIKKYGNRRLYDTSASEYITLEQLAQRIREGALVKVVHAKSGEDLTQPTLTQIILDSRGAARLLPVPLLVRLIRLGDDALAEFFGTYLTWALDMYLRLRRGAGAMASFNPFAGQMMFPMPFADFFTGRGRAEPASSAADVEPPAGGPTEQVADELAELRRELEELKREMSRGRRKRS